MRNVMIQRYHIGRMTKLLSEKDAEIARLRDALECIAAGAPTTEPKLPHGEQLRDPMAVARTSYDKAWWEAANIARKALEGKA